MHRTLGPGLLESACDDRILVELKTVERLLPIHDLAVGLLVNFNVIVLKTALRHLTPEHPDSFRSSDLPVPTKSSVDGPTQ
jgi:hypothetical protein